MSDYLHLVCPNCQSVNRVPAARLAQNPKCGKCHQPIFNSKPLALNSATYNKHIHKNDIPVLVDFWAPWCEPCKMMAPAFVEAARILEPRVRLTKVNTESEQTLASQYAIRSIPTLALFIGGKEAARQSGAISAQDIVRWVNAYI